MAQRLTKRNRKNRPLLKTKQELSKNKSGQPHNGFAQNFYTGGTHVKKDKVSSSSQQSWDPCVVQFLASKPQNGQQSLGQVTAAKTSNSNSSGGKQNGHSKGLGHTGPSSYEASVKHTTTGSNLLSKKDQQGDSNHHSTQGSKSQQPNMFEFAQSNDHSKKKSGQQSTSDSHNKKQTSNPEKPASNDETHNRKAVKPEDGHPPSFQFASASNGSPHTKTISQVEPSKPNLSALNGSSLLSKNGKNSSNQHSNPQTEQTKNESYPQSFRFAPSGTDDKDKFKQQASKYVDNSKRRLGVIGKEQALKPQ